MRPGYRSGHDRARATGKSGLSWEETYPSDRWEQGAYLLGNLTLLEGALNREAHNEEYSSKLRVCRKSQYALTSRIPEMAPEEWTEELVANRQEHLARQATHVGRADFA